MFKKITLPQVIEWGTYLLVFLLPWQTRFIYRLAMINNGYWEYGSSSLYLTEIILGVLIVLFFIYLKKNRIKFPPSRLVWLLVALLLWNLLTAFWSLDWNLTIYSWSVLACGFLFYFLISHGPAKKIGLMIVFVISAVIQSLLAWYQFLTQSIFASKWLGLAAHRAEDLGVFVIEYGDQRWLRAYGSLPHPNMLAAFLVIALIFLFVLSLEADDRQKRLFVGLSWIVMIPALLFTFSRAAWLGFAVCYLVFIIWLIVKKIKNRLTIQLLILGVVLAGVLGAMFWQPVTARVLGEQRLEIFSNQERVNLYNQSKILIKDFWYRGVGLGNYTLAVNKQIDSSWPVWAYQPVHNIYLLALAEVGIIGLGLYLFVICYLLFRVRNILAVKLALIVLLIIGLFDHFLWSLYLGILLWWFIIGLIDKKDYVSNSEKS
jgi:O-antigen ligase